MENQIYKNVALIGKYKSPNISKELSDLANLLQEHNCNVQIESQTAENIADAEKSQFKNCDISNIQQIAETSDLAIVLGGDGTMLGTARHLVNFQVPLLGVNQGRLGFLTDLDKEKLPELMSDLLSGNFISENRLLLQGEICRNGAAIVKNLALNDIVIDKGSTGRLIEFELFIDGEFISEQHGDGLIVSTPTGSTAYSLSAGGPIMHPSLNGFALIPLCPHTLTHRPLVVADSAKIELQVSPINDVQLHFDGQMTFALHGGDRIKIQSFEKHITFLHPKTYSYFSTVRNKFHWAERITK